MSPLNAEYMAQSLIWIAGLLVAGRMLGRAGLQRDPVRQGRRRW